MKKKKGIVFWVLTLHVILVGGLWLYSPLSPKTPPRKPLAVRTIQVQNEIEPTIAPEKPIPTPVSPPTPKPQPTPKPKPPAKPTSPTTTPKKSATTQKNAAESKKQQELVSLLQESLKGLESSSAPKAPTLSSEALLFATTYEEELVSHLESLLSFPEKGEVKLFLTLNRSGKVEKVEFGQATNPKNIAYLEKRLPTLSLPPFGNHWKGHTTHTFTLHLKGG